MKKIALILFTLLLLPSQSWAHAWLKLRIATTEYPPFTSTEMEHDGYINHITRQAFLEAGVVVEFTSMAWEDALKATLDGKYDAVSYGNFVRTREDEFWHSKPITAENLVFLSRKDSGIDTWETLGDLKAHTMGMTEGYLYTDELSKYIKDNESVATRKTDKDNINALLNGDIDIFPIDELTGWYLLQSEFSKEQRRELHHVQPFISTITTHLLVPKDQQDSRLVLELFNRGIEQLTLDGKMQRFKRLLKQGFYQNPQKPVNYDRR